MDMYAPQAFEQVREESIRRLDSGGLPVLAERRLAALFGSAAERFTTQLSVSEFAVARSIGLRSISQVMGSCVYHAQYAVDRVALASTAERGKAYCMPYSEEPWNAAREKALGRMSAEARSCGADAVVGVSIRLTQEHMGGEDAARVECVTMGTAVVHSTSAAGRHAPALTTLSAQDYWKLLHQGFDAVGVVAHTAVIGCVPGGEARKAEHFGALSAAGRESWEIPEFTEGLRLAHATALTEMRDQAWRMSASGIVGVTFERDQHAVQVSNANYKDLVLVVHAIGTAVVPSSTPPPGNPLTITPVQRLDKKGGIEP
jgi:uncharacterized protein YbjQ (UPF0145 family)